MGNGCVKLRRGGRNDELPLLAGKVFGAWDPFEVPIHNGVYVDQEERNDPSVVPPDIRIIRPTRYKWGTSMHRPDRIQLYGNKK